MYTKSQLATEIVRFLSTRPGFEYGNYSSGYRDAEGRRAYFADVRQATKQRRDALDMLAYITRSDSITVGMMLYSMPSRVTLSPAGELDYCAGQYYPIEYRRAIAQWLSSTLWAYFRDQCHADSADKIRTAARRELGRGIASRYFR